MTGLEICKMIFTECRILKGVSRNCPSFVLAAIISKRYEVEVSERDCEKAAIELGIPVKQRRPYCLIGIKRRDVETVFIKI